MMGHNEGQGGGAHMQNSMGIKVGGVPTDLYPPLGQSRTADVTYTGSIRTKTGLEPAPRLNGHSITVTHDAATEPCSNGHPIAAPDDAALAAAQPTSDGHPIAAPTTAALATPKPRPGTVGTIIGLCRNTVAPRQPLPDRLGIWRQRCRH